VISSVVLKVISSCHFFQQEPMGRDGGPDEPEEGELGELKGLLNEMVEGGLPVTKSKVSHALVMEMT
jgi:hypothetical protein